MARKASPTIIGGFAVGAVVLAIAGIFLFGSGALFKDTTTYVLHFGSSLKGLSVGAPVTFKGVKVGQVSSITLVGDVEDLSFQIPVLIEIDRDAIVRVRQGRVVDDDLTGDPSQVIKQLIDNGLRAQLQVRSVVTGMLEIALDFHPGKPADLKDTTGEYPEIPTITSSMQELTNTVENIPIEEITTAVLDTIRSIESLVSSPALSEPLESTNETLKRIETFVQHLDESIVSLSSNVEGAVSDIRKLTRDIDAKLDPVSGKILEGLTTLGATLEQLEQTLVTAEKVAAEGSPTRERLDHALEDLSRAAKSIGTLTEYLERHPEALLRGKGGK
jgi:paraquat-inducible protein B